MNNPRVGSSFDSFLDEEQIRDEVEDLAQKRILAWQLEQAMKERGTRKLGGPTRNIAPQDSLAARA